MLRIPPAAAGRRIAAPLLQGLVRAAVGTPVAAVRVSADRRWCAVRSVGGARASVSPGRRKVAAESL